MLQNAYFLAKIGADTAENERNFAKNWQLPYGPSAAGAQGRSFQTRTASAAALAIHCPVAEIANAVTCDTPSRAFC